MDNGRIGAIDRRTALAGLAASALLPTTAAGARAAPIVARIVLEDDRIWVGATIAGKAPLLFIVDTGAEVSLIQPSVAAKLGLRRRGITRLGGVGGADEFILYEAPELILGGAIRQAKAIFAAPRQDLRFAPGTAGLLAAGMLTTLDSELDFDAGEWRVYPGGRGERGGYRALRSEIRADGGEGSDKIYVDAELDDRRYRLLVDTGAPGQILLFGKATLRSGMWNEARPYAMHRLEGIAGTAKPARLVRGGRLDLGGIAFDRPLVSLQREVERRDGIDGILGLGLLERLTLSTDVKAARLWARANARTIRPERYGLTGLWLEQDGDRVVVDQVSPASPAADAGIRRGDEVLGGTLAQLIRRLAGKPGVSVDLETRRGGVPRPVKLVLREFL